MLIASLLLLLAQASPTPIVVRTRPPVVVQNQTPPPQPYYPVYGSLARQRTVYQNIQQQDAERQLREYRRFREEVNRQVVYRQPQTVVYERQPITVRVRR